MSWWTNFRDTLETGAGIVANYFYPGTGILGHWVNSKGSQEQLYGTTWGQLGLMGGGLLGAGMGNMANYGTAMNAVGGGAEGTSGALGGSESLGFTGASTVGANPLDNQYVQQLLDQGYTQEQAISMAQQSGALPSSGAGPGFTGQNMPGAAGAPGGGSTFGPAPMGGPTGGVGVGGAGTAYGAAGTGGPAGGAGAMPWGSMGNLGTMATGALGLMESNQIRQAGMAASKQADPFGPYRQQYADQMAALSKDPSQVTKLPGYQAGLEAVQRSMAAQGYTGSGNMMAALAKYGGDFYNAAMDRFAGWAGAGVNPGTGAGINLAGQMGGANLMMNSLGLLGKGTTMAGG